MSHQRNDFTAWILAILILLIVGGFLVFFLVRPSQVRVVVAAKTPSATVAMPIADELRIRKAESEALVEQREEYLQTTYPRGFVVVTPARSTLLFWTPDKVEQSVKVFPERGEAPFEIDQQFSSVPFSYFTVSVADWTKGAEQFVDVPVSDVAVPHNAPSLNSTGHRQRDENGKEFELVVERIDENYYIFVLGFRQIGNGK